MAAVVAALVLAPGTTGCLALALRREEADRAEVDALEREIEGLRMQVELARQQAATCVDPKAEPDDLFYDLHQVFASLDGTVEREGRATIVTLPGVALFDAGSVELRPEADMYLDLVSHALKVHAGYRVTVIGHTDDRPPSGRLARRYPTNWELSAARAAVVVRRFVDEFGLDPAIFTVAGRASYEPLVPNDTPEGRAVNRRVVLRIEPDPTVPVPP